jgi:DNA-binding NarL/FixJ family response regulator
MSACSKAILIVDDNNFLRSVLREFLKASVELEVCEAADGTEAIEKAKALKPSIIIMDLLMPRMNGIQAASVIHKDIPDARIILFSLYAHTIGKVMAQAVGVDVIVEKAEGAAGLMKALQPFLADSAPPAA